LVYEAYREVATPEARFDSGDSSKNNPHLSAFLT